MVVLTGIFCLCVKAAPGQDYRPAAAAMDPATAEEALWPWSPPEDKPEPESIGQGILSQSGGLPTYNPGRPLGALSGRTVFLNPGHGWYYSTVLGRWATQRGNNYGVIEDHSNAEAVFNHLTRYLHNAGANVWTCRERDTNTNMVIMDNGDGPPGFTVTGTWPTSTAAGSWIGSNYQHCPVSTTETAVATYTPSIPEAGYYCVYIWTPSASNRSTHAKVRVRHTGGVTTHVIDMQRDGNTYRFLGQYYFNAGRDAARGSVDISNQGSDTSKYVIADAVRFGGGMGSVVNGGSTSGRPRWEEAGNHFAYFMGFGTSLDPSTVRAMPRYAQWESESWEDSIYISWHTNATGSTTLGHSTDVYVYGPNPPASPFSEFSGVAGGDTLAIRIRDEIVNDLRIAWNDPSWPGRLFSAWFGELDPVENDEMPGVLIEVAFHDNPLDVDSIADPRFRDLVARAVYQAIVKWWYYHADGPSSTPITTETLLPEPPTHLAVRNLGQGTVRVSWRPPPYNTGNGLLGDAATGYKVSMSTDGYGFDDGTATTDPWLDVPGLPEGSVYYFRVAATNAGGESFPSETGGVRVSSDPAPILVVNGFDRLDGDMMLAEDDPYDVDPVLRERLFRMNHYGYIRTYAAALADAGRSFDFCANEAVIDGDVDLRDYAMVVWQCGEESSVDLTFDPSEQSRVQAYLNAGGGLFVSGSEIGWDLAYLGHGASFYSDYLKARFASDDADTYNVTPAAGGLFDGVGLFSFDNGSTIYNVDYPDVIIPTGGSMAALLYSGGAGGAAGLIFDDAFRIVHLAFPFEAITSASARAEIMRRAVEFLLAAGLKPDFDGDGDVDMTDFAHFQACLSGPSIPQTDADCFDTRFDADSDVDVDDLAALLPCLSGAGVPADPNCMN